MSIVRAARKATQRRLSDLVALAGANDGSGRAAPVYLANPSAARACVAEGHDPVLYTAYRDVVPPRTIGAASWYADLVAYQADDLPGGELTRSVGHWNTPAQLEVFHTVSGRILVLTAHRSSAGTRDLRFQVCLPGDLAAVPFGAWHLTCALDGPAAVFNLYTDVAALIRPHDRTSRHSADNPGEKYTTRSAVEVTALRVSGDGFTVTGPGLASWGRPIPVRGDRWLYDAVGPGGLTEFFRHAVPDQLQHLQELALTHLPQDTAAVPRGGGGGGAR